MKRLAIVAVIAIVATVAWYRRGSVATQEPEATHATHGPVEHVTTLDPSERREVAGRIARAQASHAATPRPSLPPIATRTTPAPALDSQDPDAMKQTLRAAMREVVSHIMSCYEASFSTRGHKALVFVARLTLTGDPDIGTLIDAPQLNDTSGAPLPARLDDCLRDTFQSLELPPLAEGDHVVVDWPFTFRPAVEDEGTSSDDDDLF